MKLHTVAAALLVGLGLASCNEQEQPKPQTQARPNFLASMQGRTFQTSPNLAAQDPGDMGAARPSASALPTGPGPVASVEGVGRSTGLRSVPPAPAKPAAAAPTEPQIQFPKDARWTLYCTSVTGPDRFPQTAQLKSMLIASTGLKDWYVVHNERESTLFYGFYPAVERSAKNMTAADQAAANKAHREREKIITLKNDRGQMPFATAFFTPITPPNPVAPAEWDLTNAPTGSYWSVQVMAFMDNPLRKQAAVDAVKELRDKGVVAYFYHGDTISSVCIGTWPPKAVREQDTDMSEAMVNQDDAVLVTQMPLPDKYRNSKMQTRDGQRLVSYAQRIDIDDPSLDATLKEYPEHVVNYERRSRKVQGADGKTQEAISPSFLVMIPRSEQNLLTNGGAGGFMSNPVSGTTTRQPAETQGLRSLGSTEVWQGGKR